ncbi:hypothetical protein D3C81_2201820 [compost metagenome]
MQADLPGEAIGNGLHDGQAQARTLIVSAAVEALEHPLAFGLIDARSLVFDRQLEPACLLAQTHGDDAMDRRKGGGIAH